MKAIVKVKNGSSYSKFNGLTFEVAEINTSFAALLIDGKTTDFGLSEVLICDLQNEIQTRFEACTGNNHTPKLAREYWALKAYLEVNKIQVEPLEGITASPAGRLISLIPNAPFLKSERPKEAVPVLHGEKYATPATAERINGLYKKYNDLFVYSLKTFLYKTIERRRFDVSGQNVCFVVVRDDVGLTVQALKYGNPEPAPAGLIFAAGVPADKIDGFLQEINREAFGLDDVDAERIKSSALYVAPNKYAIETGVLLYS